MSAENFFKKAPSFLVKCLSFFCVGISVVYATIISLAQVVDKEKTFYFLTSEDTNVEAATYDVLLQGGAGYLLTIDKRERVVLSAYLSNEQGRAVAEEIEGTKLLSLSTGKLYFKTLKQKRFAKTAVSALERLYSCLNVLTWEITRLDKGATQESSKRVLNGLAKQFAYMKKEHQSSYKGFAAVCKNAEESLRKMTSDIVFTRDLRFLQCELCIAYYQLSKEFSI